MESVSKLILRSHLEEDIIGRFFEDFHNLVWYFFVFWPGNFVMPFGGIVLLNHPNIVTNLKHGPSFWVSFVKIGGSESTVCFLSSWISSVFCLESSIIISFPLSSSQTHSHSLSISSQHVSATNSLIWPEVEVGENCGCGDHLVCKKFWNFIGVLINACMNTLED